MGQNDIGERRQRARGILAQFKESGLSQREFAAQEGVSASTLAYWIRRERLEQEIRGETALVAVSTASPSAMGFVIEIGEVRIELPRDTTVEEWSRLREAWAS
jgi:transcriptional regulator with XRE-family HTH domain